MHRELDIDAYGAVGLEGGQLLFELLLVLIGLSVIADHEMDLGAGHIGQAGGLAPVGEEGGVDEHLSWRIALLDPALELSSGFVVGDISCPGPDDGDLGRRDLIDIGALTRVSVDEDVVLAAPELAAGVRVVEDHCPGRIREARLEPELLDPELHLLLSRSRIETAGAPSSSTTWDWLVWRHLDWQSRGQGFKSLQLHSQKSPSLPGVSPPRRLTSQTPSWPRVRGSVRGNTVRGSPQE